MSKKSLIGKSPILSLLLISGLYSSCGALEGELTQGVFERQKAWFSNACNDFSKWFYGLPTGAEWVDESFYRDAARDYWRIKKDGNRVQVSINKWEASREYPVGVAYADREWLAASNDPSYKEFEGKSFDNLPLGRYVFLNVWDVGAFCAFKKVRGWFGRTYLCAMAHRYDGVQSHLSPIQRKTFATFTEGCTDIDEEESDWVRDEKDRVYYSVWDESFDEAREWEKQGLDVRWAKECEAYIENRGLRCMTCGKGFDDTDDVVPCDKHGLFHRRCYMNHQRDGGEGCPVCTKPEECVENVTFQHTPQVHLAKDCERYEQDLKCSVCHDKFEPTSKVVQCTNGHLVHVACYSECEKAGSRTCPECRGPIATNSISKNPSWSTRWSRLWSSLWTWSGKNVEPKPPIANKNI